MQKKLSKLGRKHLPRIVFNMSIMEWVIRKYVKQEKYIRWAWVDGPSIGTLKNGLCCLEWWLTIYQVRIKECIW